MRVHILIVVEPTSQRSRLRALLQGIDYAMAETAGKNWRWQSLNQQEIDLIVISHSLLPEPYENWIQNVRNLPEHPEIVVLWDREDPQVRAALLKAGCVGVLYQKLSDEELADTLSAFVERRRQEELNLLKVERLDQRSSLQDFVSNSLVMQQFMVVVKKIVNSESSILLLGETGVGKERLARAIHQEGPRSSGPFLAVNCSALPETLLESELFGHEQGAFTGASRARRGYFELAHGGTIFLDEIGEVPLHLQVKLLRVLEDRIIQRLGSEKTTRVDVRIMAATNRDLEKEVRDGGFRSDLYYRLAVVTLEVPPLRERIEDIPPLAESYLAHFCFVLGRQLSGIGSDALAALVRYTWPGNVRELINVMERAVLLSSGPEIALEDLPKVISNLEGEAMVGARKDFMGVDIDSLHNFPLRKARREVVDAFEKAYLTGVLRSTQGKISEAARHAGINERSLYELMKSHGLRKEEFKAKARQVYPSARRCLSSNCRPVAETRWWTRVIPNRPWPIPRMTIYRSDLNPSRFV